MSCAICSCLDDLEKFANGEGFRLVKQALVERFDGVESKRGEALVEIRARGEVRLILDGGVVLDQLFELRIVFQDLNPRQRVTADLADHDVLVALRDQLRQLVVATPERLQWLHLGGHRLKHSVFRLERSSEGEADLLLRTASPSGEKPQALEVNGRGLCHGMILLHARRV